MTIQLALKLLIIAEALLIGGGSLWLGWLNVRMQKERQQ